MQQLVREKGQAAVADALLPKLVGDTTRRERPDVIDDLRRQITGNSVESIAGALDALMTRPDSTPTLATIHCPVQILVGDEDAITPPALSEQMHTRHPRLRADHHQRAPATCRTWSSLDCSTTRSHDSSSIGYSRHVPLCSGMGMGFRYVRLTLDAAPVVLLLAAFAAPSAQDSCRLRGSPRSISSSISTCGMVSSTTAR